MLTFDQKYHDNNLNVIDKKYDEAIIQAINQLKYIHEDVGLMQGKLASLNAPNHARAYIDGEHGIFIRWQLPLKQIRFMFITPEDASILSKDYTPEFYPMQAEFMIHHPFEAVMHTIDNLSKMDSIHVYKFVPLFYESLIVKITVDGPDDLP